MEEWMERYSTDDVLAVLILGVPMVVNATEKEKYRRCDL